MAQKLKEDVPVMSAGSGAIAGIGVGPDGEPGVDMTKLKKTRKKKSDPMRKIVESQKPVNPELWRQAQRAAKEYFPHHPTPESTKFAIAWYLHHGGTTASNVAKNEENTPTDREWGTDSLTKIYKHDTPGELEESLHIITRLGEAWEKITTCQQCKKKLSPRELQHGFRVCDKCVTKNKGKVWGKDSDDDYVEEDFSEIQEAEYQGRNVTLNKPFRTPGGPKKFAVYVTNENGNVIKLGFGDPNLSIKRDDPERRKNFLARHNCSDPGPKWKAKYWSCKWGWGKKPISDKLKEGPTPSVTKLTEGGNVFKDVSGEPLTKRIARADVAPTIKWLESVTGLDLTGPPSTRDKQPSYWLGTTGRKADSGDLDVLINANKTTKEQLIQKLQQWVNKQPNAKTTTYVKKSGISVHFFTPIKGDSKNGYVQTDFMFMTNPDWSEFISYSEPSSQFKGQDRFIALNSLATYFNYKISQTDGLLDRGTNKVITDNPTKLAQLLLTPQSTEKDIQSVETILAALKTDAHQTEKLAAFKDFLATNKRAQNGQQKLALIDKLLQQEHFMRSFSAFIREAKTSATLIAVPKNSADGDGKGFWKIGTEVYRASVDGATDTAGLPMDKRWESSFDHFARYWDGVYAKFYAKTKAWTPTMREDAAPLDKPTLEPEAIAKKHGVTTQDIEQELTRGIEVEQEHTSNKEVARQIALDHLAELPDYYTRLKTMEEAPTTHWSKKWQYDIETPVKPDFQWKTACGTWAADKNMSASPTCSVCAKASESEAANSPEV